MWKFDFFLLCKLCWVIRTQPISILKLFLLYPWLALPYFHSSHFVDFCPEKISPVYLCNSGLNRSRTGLPCLTGGQKKVLFTANIFAMPAIVLIGKYTVLISNDFENHPMRIPTFSFHKWINLKSTSVKTSSNSLIAPSTLRFWFWTYHQLLTFSYKAAEWDCANNLSLAFNKQQCTLLQVISQGCWRFQTNTIQIFKPSFLWYSADFWFWWITLSAQKFGFRF